MTFPPGWSKLTTKPAPTASIAFGMTIGIVAVTLLMANTAGVVIVTITSALSATNSLANCLNRSG